MSGSQLVNIFGKQCSKGRAIHFPRSQFWDCGLIEYLARDAQLSCCRIARGGDEIGGQAQAFDSSKWGYITADPSIDGDCGGKFLTYWYQNMPGLGNEARDGADPMKNWWPFMFY